jgi:ABC-type transport system involved in cytochrome bd biosynthesis fused ATPase/permease subunit
MKKTCKRGERRAKGAAGASTRPSIILILILISILILSLQFPTEKVRYTHEAEKKLESQAQNYEEKITELHSVIAELKKRSAVKNQRKGEDEENKR